MSAHSRTDHLRSVKGHQTNEGTGLYYYGARYYHPGLARFISQDPVGFLAGDPNLYLYVGNNPLTYLDPPRTAEIKVFGQPVTIFRRLTVAFVNLQPDLTRVSFHFNGIPSRRI